jgi:hypothetical protein
MSALPILSPFPVFTSLDGMPLNNGRIYVGTAGLDPVTNQVPLWWDEALSIAASQPVATSGGYAVRNGTPSVFYADAASVSILVQDEYGVTVFTADSLDAVSVGLSGGTTGLTVANSPVTGSGTMTLGGTLAVANGGTGGTTQSTARSGIGAAASGANTDITSIRQSVNVAATGAIDANHVGYRGMPIEQQNGAYTLVLADAGKGKLIDNTVTVPANSATAFPVGTVIGIINRTNTPQTIQITTDTMRQSGTANTGSRTLAVYGEAYLKKIEATSWYISGNIS